MIPVCDLQAHVQRYRDEIDHAVARVLDSGWFVLGPCVEAFERQFADYIGVQKCVTVANGTDALELALKALGAGPGSRVATVANAGGYSAIAIKRLGAVSIFMDVSAETKLISAYEVERAIASGAGFVVVTHLYGQAISGIEEIAAFCRGNGVRLVEDCAQAHGAMVAGRKVGSFGDCGAFSFYPTKNLGALGDGGAVVTNQENLGTKLRSLRQYGWERKYVVETTGGFNSRLDEIQAAILRVFLPYLDGWNERRRDIARQYSERIVNPHIVTPPPGRQDYVAHLYVVRSKRRDSLAAFMKSKNISTDIHYPLPDHLQPALNSASGSTMRLPITEQLANEVLTLPCYPELTEDNLSLVIDAANEWTP